ncbi:hypothetical protein DFH06DRAFT_903298, partial [Mycena polygramma]
LTLTAAVLCAIASVAASDLNGLKLRQNYNPCPEALYMQPQCCATSLLGVVTLKCSAPPSAPTNKASFETICAGVGM